MAGLQHLSNIPKEFLYSSAMIMIILVIRIPFVCLDVLLYTASSEKYTQFWSLFLSIVYTVVYTCKDSYEEEEEEEEEAFLGLRIGWIWNGALYNGISQNFEVSFPKYFGKTIKFFDNCVVSLLGH
jgi:hypothetical protein